MIFEVVQLIIAEQLDAELEEITLDTNLMNDLGADSLDKLEIIDKIEGTFHIEVDDDNLDEVNIVKDIVTIIRNKVGE